MTAAPWLDTRLKVAEHAAAVLADEYASADVWLVGAFAEGLAHQHSDVDLLLITQKAVPGPGSRLIHGIRVDVRAVSESTVDDWRTLLDAFTVTRDGIETFRTVRARLSDLTLLRTARPLSTAPDRAAILVPEQRATYQRWALADRCEVAASLAEDLLGLAHSGLYPHADLVWDQLARVVAQAETVAAGAPLLGEKWLPSLLSRDDAEPFRPVPALPEPRWLSAAAHSPFFASVQARLADALLALWPTDAEPEPVDEAGLGGFGWLPQRYSDGWFLRRGDARVPLTAGRIRAWQKSAARRARS
ncbi:nucleotidyltransferase domain-containing protein [Streptomyces sp. NBC_01571]|uniref:nucleotidyltransferase domain-containing protein n=1 Tax=Streptomyces sp. NBC_01571 TaxID=2975883 RepID=UPI002257052B|nr:nucleotidyltransferase domain-containing protein [Streptomyces sp. NBC_01571]MCX4573423.1 nucleotidyltransferase domain-containing protein [Streptomyces sp. NBC_01571]